MSDTRDEAASPSPEPGDSEHRAALDEARRKMTVALDYHLRERDRLYQLADEHDDAAGRLHEHAGALLDGQTLAAIAAVSLEVEPSDGLPRIWTFKELYEAAIPRPAGIINGRIFCPGSVGLVAGPGGIGKSWLTKFIAGAVSLGRNIAALPTTASNVVFFSEEMDEAEVHDRILQLSTPEDAEAIFDRTKFICQSGVLLDSAAGLTRLRRILEKSGCPPLSLIDALSDVKGTAKENDNDQMGAILRGLRGVARDVGTAAQAVHHYGKPSEFKKGTDLVRGASAIRDVCADIITVTRSKKSRLVEFAKVRHGVEPTPFTFDIEGDGGDGPVRLVFGEAAAGSGFEEAGHVIQTVREEGGRLDRQTLLGILKRKKGWSENTAQKHIDVALTSPSLLRKTKVGKLSIYETG